MYQLAAGNRKKAGQTEVTSIIWNMDMRYRLQQTGCPSYFLIVSRVDDVCIIKSQQLKELKGLSRVITSYLQVHVCEPLAVSVCFQNLCRGLFIWIFCVSSVSQSQSFIPPLAEYVSMKSSNHSSICFDYYLESRSDVK